MAGTVRKTPQKLADEFYMMEGQCISEWAATDEVLFCIAKAKVAAVARTVLFRRVRSVLIRVHGEGLIAHTLNFDYEVRQAEEAFGELPASKADHELLDLALHIIKKKAGSFDPKKFDDRYDAARPGVS